MRKEDWGLCALVALAACGGSGSEGSGSSNSGSGIDPSGATDTDESGTTDPDPTGDDDDTTDTDSSAAVVSIALEPPEAMIEIVDGAIPPAVDFNAIATLADGSTTPLTGTWTFDRPDLGDIINTGELTASGFSGGLGVVTFAAEGLTAEADVTIKVHIVDDDSVDPTVIPLFEGAVTPDPSLVWSYPYDATVFPKGLRGPTLQWGGGADADIYYVHADSPTFEYEFWGQAVNPSRFDFPDLGQDVWQLLTDSVTGQLDVSIQRYDGTQAYLPIDRNWTIADAVLTGSVYYWEVNNGSVVRLETGADAPETFLQLPEGVQCVACHSVSKDGSTIVASFHGGYSPWGTFNAQDGTSILTTDTGSGFQAISPDGSHVLWGQYGNGSDFNLTLSLSDDPTPLAQLAPPAANGAPVYPAWSTDGNSIAFAMRHDGNYLDFNSSSLWVANVDLVTPGFSNLTEIVTGDAVRPAPNFPTYSPDSQWIAFMRSTQARARGAQAEVWLTDTTGATQIALDAANGVGVIDQTDANYEPTFLPVSLGGYFWLVFVSERTYGNTLTNTDPASRQKQLWVTAIDASPSAGSDPSHPAFWLPGQEVNNQNMRGEWALNPCKELGETCESGYECCEGFCQPDETGALTCSPPGECAQVGEACDTADDCCDQSLSCIGGFCAPYVPG